MEPSKTSPMPVNLLTKEEALDLLAHVLSGGDSAHVLFQK